MKKKELLLGLMIIKKLFGKITFIQKQKRKFIPILSFAMTDKNLLVADSIAKISSINLQTGNLIWSKKVNIHLIQKSKFLRINFL